MENMYNSYFKLNGENIDLNNIEYKDNNLEIICKNPICGLNISFINTKELLLSLKNNIKTNISNDIYLDQNFYTDNFSYVIEIANNIYLTKLENNYYLLELYLSNINIVIPPFDNKNNNRVNLSEEKQELKSLEAYIYFKI